MKTFFSAKNPVFLALLMVSFLGIERVSAQVSGGVFAQYRTRNNNFVTLSIGYNGGVFVNGNFVLNPNAQIIPVGGIGNAGPVTVQTMTLNSSPTACIRAIFTQVYDASTNQQGAFVEYNLGGLQKVWYIPNYNPNRTYYNGYAVDPNQIINGVPRRDQLGQGMGITRRPPGYACQSVVNPWNTWTGITPVQTGAGNGRFPQNSGGYGNNPATTTPQGSPSVIMEFEGYDGKFAAQMLIGPNGSGGEAAWFKNVTNGEVRVYYVPFYIRGTKRFGTRSETQTAYLVWEGYWGQVPPTLSGTTEYKVWVRY